MTLSEQQQQLLHKLYYVDLMKVGRDKLYQFTKTNYADYNIKRDDIGEFLKKQEINQLLAEKPSKVKDIKRTVLNEPFAQMGIDLVDMTTKAVTVNGKTYKWIFSAVDLFSRKLYSLALTDKEDKTVLNGFKELLKQMKQTPRSIRSDNDSSFTSTIFKKYLDEMEIKQILSSAGKPQSNGGIERVQQTLKHLLARNMIYDDNNNWVSLLNKMVDIYNNTYHRIIEMTPNQSENRSNKEIRDNILENIKPKNESLENFNKPVFKVGDTVRIRLEELGPKKNIGSLNFSKELYTVSRVTTPRQSSQSIYYRVKDANGEIPTNYYKEQLLLILAVENPIKEPTKYIINKIMDEKIEGGQKYLLIKWKYYPSKKDWTWEKYDVIKNDAFKVVQLYERAKNN